MLVGVRARASLLNTSVLAVVALASAWIFSAPVRHLGNAMGYVADDFYYYAKIAHNIAVGLGSTFDGVTPTNGYHPLYTVMLVPFTRSGNMVPIFWYLYALSFCAAIATFVFARRTFARTGCDVVLANGLALLTLALPFRMFFQGMEVTLTIPLETAFLFVMLSLLRRERLSTSAAFCAGILAAAMVFSRLDSALFVLLLCGIAVTVRETRERLSVASIAAFAAALGVPVVAYVAWNKARFGALTPISGVAKQMRFSHVPSSVALMSIWRGLNGKILVAFAVVALIGWFWQRRKLPPEWRVVVLAAALFPWVHVGLLCVLSDWQMWGWYHYSFLPAMIAVFAMAAFGWQRRTQRDGLAGRSAEYALLAVGLVITGTNHWRLDGEMGQIAVTARAMQPWIAAHPGKYAMGDRAGMVAWLSPQPFFQTEGLVEDRAWLKTIRDQGDLVSALRARGVHYYITTEWQKKSPPGQVGQPFFTNGCYNVVEPAQAGPSAPHLRSRICASPIATFETGGDMPKRTLVFDLGNG